MFKTRLASGVVLVILALIFLIAGGPVLLAVTTVISLIGMFELYRVFHIEKSLPGMVGYLALVIFDLNLAFGFLCATAHTLGIAVDIPSAIVLSILATLSACGASGVAGGSLLLIPMACSLFGISNDVAMQVVSVGFIIGVVQDSFETALNSSSDLLLSASAEFRQWRKEGKEIKF